MIIKYSIYPYALWQLIEYAYSWGEYIWTLANALPRHNHTIYTHTHNHGLKLLAEKLVSKIVGTRCKMLFRFSFAALLMFSLFRDFFWFRNRVAHPHAFWGYRTLGHRVSGWRHSFITILIWVWSFDLARNKTTFRNPQRSSEPPRTIIEPLSTALRLSNDTYKWKLLLKSN